MAKDLKAFLLRINEDPAFAEEVRAKDASIAETENISDERELTVRVGKEMGYEFTSDDIKKAESKLAKLAAGTEELSGDRTRLDMDNLESVAGGVLPIDGCCFGGNHDWKLVGKEKGFAWGNNLHYQCRICFDKASEWEKYPWEDFIDWITE